MRYTYRTLQDRCDSTGSCLKTCCINGCIAKIQYDEAMEVFNMKRLAGINPVEGIKYSSDYVDNYQGQRTLVDKIHPHFLNI